MGIFSKMFGRGVADSKAPSKAPAEPKENDFLTALSMQVRGEVEPALAAYTSIADKAPDDSLAPFFAAAIKAANGNTDEAVQSLRALSGRIAAAGESISRVIAVELHGLLSEGSTRKIPAVAEIAASFGEHLKKEGFLRESAVCFEIAIGLAPDNAHMLLKLGDALHDLRMYDYAESVLQEALKHAPNLWGALYTYAVLLQDMGRNEDAITYYERAVQLDGSHVSCRNNYGAALLRVGRLEEALAHCGKAAELDPNAPLVKINLGYIHSLRQDYEAARTCFSEAISINDKLAPALYGLASIEQALGSDPKRIEELYHRAIEANPSQAEAHHALANLLASQGDAQALSHFAKAAELNDNLRNLHRDFGYACLQSGRRDEALEHLRKALLQSPDDAVVQDLISRAEAQPS